MKGKYDRLTKEEKKQIKEEYINKSESNKNYYKRIRSIKIISIFGIVYSILMIFIDFLLKLSLINKIIDCLLLIFCIYFITRSHNLLKVELNKFIISKKK